MIQREFQNTVRDFSLVWEFISGIDTDPAWVSSWDYCRFESWYYRLHAVEHQDDPGFFSRNLELWLDEGQNLLGLAISESGETDYDLICPPRNLHLAGPMIDWVDRTRSQSDSKLTLSISETDQGLQEAAAGRGYEKSGRNYFKFDYDLDRVELGYRLEPGFEIVAAAHEGFDHQSRIALIKNSFKRDSYPPQKHFNTMRAPSYRAALDLSVMAPDGVHVSYCLGWINRLTGWGMVEPVGTHSGYRRRGLASAVIKECFKRMQGLGVKTVRICGSSPLYDTLNPVAKRGIHFWEKQF